MTICNQCKKRKIKENKRRCKICLSKNQITQNKFHEKLRLDIISHYNNGCCARCGENDIDVLTIDHVNNDGKHERDIIGSTYAFYSWLKKHNYPQERYQILCRNCNWKKHIQGVFKKTRSQYLPK